MARNPFAPLPQHDSEADQAPWPEIAGTVAETAAPALPIAANDGGVEIDLSDILDLDDDADNLMSIEVPEEDGGGVVIDLDPQQDDDGDQDFDANLANYLAEGIMNSIAEELLEGIAADDESRQDWIQTRKKGIDLLGMKIEGTRSTPDAGGTMEGLSTVRHPLLQEAVLRFQANAYGELCPANGPVKVVNYGDQNPGEDSLADALEKDMNYYLTNIAEEYYDDMNAMLFQVGFGGMAAKKVYYCPLRQRPVADVIDAQHLIVTNAATNIKNAGRVTQEIQMRRGVLKRMQLIGAYRDVGLGEPEFDPNPIDLKIANVQGVRLDNDRPEDQDFTIYECYCELDIPGYEHKDEDGERTGLPLPYCVTLEKTSRKILAIRRNWEEDDPVFNPKIPFVIYRYVNSMGFYGIGLLHILGNTTSAITMAWREMLDAGMFASFPGFLYLQGANRQTTNEFRIPPGGGMPIRSDAASIKDAIMPLPYKEAGPGLMQLVENISEVGQRVGGTADMPVGEGVQNAPVGTTMALIDQATKIESAVHKGLHNSQDHEFRLFKKLFEADPESMWRDNNRCALQKNVQKTLAALKDCDIVPRADPNVPSRMYRLAKIAAVKQLQMANPMLYDGKAVDTWALPQLGVDDPESFFAADPGPTQPDPVQMQKVQNDAQKNQIALMKAQIDAQNDAANRKSKENIELLKLAQSQAVHGHDANLAAAVQSNPIGQEPGMAAGGVVEPAPAPKPLKPQEPSPINISIQQAADSTEDRLRRIAEILAAGRDYHQQAQQPVFNPNLNGFDVGVI